MIVKTNSHITYLQLRSASVVQWLGFLLSDQKVMGSNPGRSKGVFF